MRAPGVRAPGAPTPRVDERLALADGRTLAWCEWGPDAGAPVLLLHGGPGSRWFCPDLAATEAAGVRLLTYDRPGYGRSTRLDWESRRLLDFVPDVDALLDHLGLGAAALVGWSAGGCVAAAFAHARPDRVTRLALVSAPGPLDEVPGAWERLGAHMRPTAETARTEPHRSRRAIARHMAPVVAEPESFVGRGSGPDGALLRDPVHGPMLRAQVTEALAPGIDGLADDLVAHWLDWGFRLADLTVPTAVFHGGRDRHNGEDAETFAREVPGARLTVWPDAGHLGVVARWTDVLTAVT